MRFSIFKYPTTNFALQLSLILFVLPINAQFITSLCKPEISNFTKQQYKGYDQNWNLAQHPFTNFIYVANSKGLLEFDGSNWELYELPNKEKIRSVTIDDQGRIFTGALGEFGFWKRESYGKLKYHSLSNLVSDPKFSEEEIWNIVPTTEGILFQSFAFIYLYSQNKVEKIEAPGSMLFASIANGEIYIPILGVGVYKLKGKKFEFLTGTKSLANESINTILKGSNGGILIGTDRKLYKYQNETLVEFNKSTNEFLTQNHLNRGILLNNGNYAFGTILDGIIFTNTEGEILFQLNQKSGLQNNTILSFAQDKEGNLWAALDKGIDLIKISSPITYFNDFSGNLGTVYDAAIIGNDLYVGTNHGVFYTSLSSKNTNFTLIPNTQGQVWDLEVIDGQLLCGHNKGTFLIKNKEAKLISSVTGGWTIKRLKSNPEFLVQGTYNELCIYSKDQNLEWAFNNKIEGFVEPISQIEETEDGVLWANKMGRQLYKIQLSNDLKKAVNISTVPLEDSSTSQLTISTFGQQLSLCNGNKTLIFNSLNNRFESNTLLDNLYPNIKISKLFSFPPIGDFVLKEDGELSFILSELSQKAVLIDKFNWVDDYENIISIDEDNFLICLDNGFAILPKKSMSKLLTKAIYDPIIKNVIISDFPEKNAYFSAIDSTANLIFNHNENTITFSVASPGHFGDVKYSYWLENSTKNWSTFEASSKKEFVNLPAGNYVFHVKSNISNKEAAIAFEIKSPWYWNWWSRTFYVVLLVSILLYLYSLHIRKTKYQQAKALKKLERRLAKQEEESNKEILRLKSHQLEQDVIRKSEEIANTTMVLIKKSELLLEIKEEVLNLKNEQNGQPTAKIYNNILHLIDSNISNENDWHVFEDNFNTVHEEFFMKLVNAYPGLSPSDMKLAALLRMNHSSKEIAQLLNITYRSVELKRYRLRKKLDIGAEVNLSEFMIKF